MRSTWARPMASQGAPPEPDWVSMRTPSTSTTVCWVLAPRTKTDVVLPGPPLRAICTPGWAASKSARPPKARAEMSSRVRTVMSASTSLTRWGMRVAVVTMVSSRFWAWAEAARASADRASSGRRAARKE